MAGGSQSSGGSSLDAERFRVEIPRSEEDVRRLEEEVQSKLGSGGEHHEEHEVEQDVAALVSSAVHMLAHLDGHVSEIAESLRNLDSRLQRLEKLLGVVARALLLPEVRNPELRERLIREIVEALE